MSKNDFRYSENFAYQGVRGAIFFCLAGVNTASCLHSSKLKMLYTVFTWQKLHSLEHALFKGEVHHHMSHTVTDFWFQREAEC